MLVNGCDCSIIIKTSHFEKDIPYSNETLREVVSILQEEAAIEGDGLCRGLRKITGVTGCVVTPLTMGTVPLLLYLAMGAAGNPVYVSETKNLFKYELNLLPTEDTEHFDLVQDRGGERLLYEGCGIAGFEMRFNRGEAIKLKLDIKGARSPRAYPYTDKFAHEKGELFNSDNVAYRINGQEYKNIYGLTITTKKEGGTRTEIWIKRVLENNGYAEHSSDFPAVIEDMTITAQLLRTQYEYRYYGTFRITIKRLILVSDETEVNSTGAAMWPVRFYVAGSVSTEVFTSTGELIP
jgi:hypothetical protein